MDTGELTAMQNDEYMKLYEKEWAKLLGQNKNAVTEQERKELHELIQAQKSNRKEDGQNDG